MANSGRCYEPKRLCAGVKAAKRLFFAAFGTYTKVGRVRIRRAKCQMTVINVSFRACVKRQSKLIAIPQRFPPSCPYHKGNPRTVTRNPPSITIMNIP